MTEDVLTPPQMEAATEGGRVAAVAARLRCTEGQLYTMVISLAAATALVGFGGVPLGDPLPARQASGPRATLAAPLAPAVVVPEPPPVAQPLPALPIGPSTSLEPPVPMVPASGLFPEAEEEREVEPGPAEEGGEPEGYEVPSPGAPRALASDASYVYAGTDDAPARLLVLSRTGDPSRLVEVGGKPTDRPGGLSAAAVRGAQLLVTDRSRGALLQVDPRSGEQRVLATLPDLPPCLVGIVGSCQPGAQDAPPSPEGIAVTDDAVYVTDAAQGTIWRYLFSSKQLSAWYTSSDFQTSGPSGLGFDTGGRLVFTVAETSDLAAPLDGALYRLEVTAAGAPGARSLLATFARGTTPGPVAVGRADDVYVGLRSSGGVVVISRDGEANALAGAAASQLPAPGGLSLADGVLYVADAGRPASPTSGRVEAVSVSDGPATG